MVTVVVEAWIAEAGASDMEAKNGDQDDRYGDGRNARAMNGTAWHQHDE
jgi:hypothetical protein